MKKLLILLAGLLSASLRAAETAWVGEAYAPGDFILAQGERLAPVAVAPGDFECVRVAAGLFTEDIERVTGHRPALVTTAVRPPGPAVLIGTLGQSPLIDQLATAGRIDAAQIRGQWESFSITAVDGSLVIAGSDRRGTAYGVFELSRAMGVSPWYWWADVAPAHRDNLFVRAGTRKFGPPSVQYRGIFINDEDWGLQPWAAKTFEPAVGNIGPKTYARICELLLRLKANTLWPAMHEVSTPFNAIPENREVADRYGIVMGASHCEPLLRNNVGEWPKDNQAAYNFLTNPQ
jgi:Glycosyl hydrolase family 115